MNDFYPEIEPFKHFLFEVSEEHTLYVEQCGNPHGEPVVFIHGGPGLGCSTHDRRFFDPDKYHIILLDQRGCGRSLPHGHLINNKTDLLVEDLEKIRKKLKINIWHIFGGSWGSVLSLIYTQTHPKRVQTLVLRGIFLARNEDIKWTYSGGGSTKIFADHWQEFIDTAGLAEGKISTKAIYNILMGIDEKSAMKMAKAWTKWEISCCTLLPNEEFLAECTSDESCWTLARHAFHYMVNNCFLLENQIIENCHKIAHIPTIIIHGRYDIVCPFENAWLLHQQLPNSQLLVSSSAGHASIEPETRHLLITATKNMLQNQS